jgi:uncharacterized protein (TIGR02145 family)/prepilin-type N-terminal cleavage/methylation domain-containing protein
MKKGFTLIELLAVIVILAIILLIAVPMVTNVIEDAKKGAIEASAGMTMKAIENEHLRQKLGGSTGEIEVVIEDYVQTSTDKLELDGKNIKEGYIHINSAGDITMVVTDGITIIEKDPTSNELNTLEEEYESQDLLAMFNTLKGSTPASFACGDVLTDSRDSNTYETTQIGTQCWMAENLRYTTPECLGATWDSTAPHDACDINGGTGWDQNEVLYQWEAAMNGDTTEGSQGLCPTGWHVASHDEWTELERSVCTSGTCESDFPKDTTTTGWRGNDEGAKLKSTDPSWSGTNTIGFNGKPAGYRGTDGTLEVVGSSARWWTSTSNGNYGWRRVINLTNDATYRGTSLIELGSSVRCILGD